MTPLPEPQADEILAVDDTLASLKLLAEILQGAGHRVRLATDGELALRSAKVQPPALILLDIRMPGMDGFEVCRKLKEEESTCSIPIIFLSVLEDEPEKLRAFECGAVDYINKPIRAAEVLARVHTHLTLRRTQLELEKRNQELEVARSTLEERVKERSAELEQANLRLHHQIEVHLRTLHALRESERKLRRIFDTTNEGIWGMGPDTKTTFVNARMAEMLGYSPEEMQGRPASDFIFEEDLADHLDRMSKRREGISENYERRLRRKDGQEVWGLASATSIMDEEKRFQGSFAMWTDITERKRAEQRLRTLNQELENLVTERTGELRRKSALLEAQANSTLEGILVVGPNDEKLFQNRRNIELFQIPQPIAKEKNYQPQFLWILDLLNNPNQLKATVDWLREHPQENHREEVELKNEIMLDQYSAPVLGTEGEHYGRIWTYRDITEQKRVERQLEKALQREIVLRREIHHRVKNNLQVIISLLYLQSTVVGDPSIVALLRESQFRVRSIALIHEMLYQRGDLDQICFTDYARQLATDLFLAFRVSHRSVTLKVGEERIFLGMDAAIPCGIIMAELITNSLKYAFPDNTPGEIEVTLRPDAEQHNLVLTVRDNGIGLPKDFTPKRADTLGMRLVCDLTHQLGGTFEFDSGSGTTMKIIFPKPEKKQL